jgi:hypothetical protein
MSPRFAQAAKLKRNPLSMFYDAPYQRQQNTVINYWIPFRYSLGTYALQNQLFKPSFKVLHIGYWLNQGVQELQPMVPYLGRMWY